MEKNGYIRRDPRNPAIEIVDDTFGLTRREMVNIPMVGTVAAGEPLLAVENINDYFPVPSHMVSGNELLFMLTVRGESMINAGIFNGDQLIVRQQETARNGEVVVALVEDSATVKTFL